THSCEDFETSHFFHPNIGHHHRHRVRRRVSEKLCLFVESAHLYAVGSEQVLHRSEDRLIVVHDTDFSRTAGIVHAAWLFESRRAAGRRKTKRAPRSGAFSALIVPPCVSTMERTMVRPIPIPACLVEKKWSKTFSGRSFGDRKS